MVSEVLPVIGNMFVSILAFCIQLYERLGALNLLFGAFMIFTIYRFVLRPILGGCGSSDKASKKVTQKNDEN